MINEIAEIRGVSDSNPIQFWPMTVDTFNQKNIGLIDKKLYFQKFKFTDPLRLDVLFNTKSYPDWQIGNSYDIGMRVYDSVSKTRWVSKVDGNIGNRPSEDYTFTNWDMDPLIAGSTPVYDLAHEYNNGDLTLNLDGTQDVLNPDFAGSLASWNPAYNNGGNAAQTWTYSGGNARLVVVAAIVNSYGIGQAIVAPSANDKYKIHIKGSIAITGGHTVDILLDYYKADNSSAGAHSIPFSASVSGDFDFTVIVTRANLHHVALSATSNLAVTIDLETSLVSVESDLNYKAYQSIADANTNNFPEEGAGVWWEQYQEASGMFNLLMNIAGEVVETLPFQGSYHQFIQMLFSDYGELEDERTSFNILDVQYDTLIAQSDCVDIESDPDPSVLLTYSNSADFDNIDYETSNPAFNLRLVAHFYEELNPVVTEDTKISSGIIVSLTAEMLTKKLLTIIEHLPAYMHRKVCKALMHDMVLIEDIYWKREEEYEKSVPETSTVSRASVWLTRVDSVLRNVSKGDPFSMGRIFSDEFSNQFS